MPTVTATDGTELAYHVRGEGEPLVVLPGGPMRASTYLGDLGGLSAHRRLILLDLRGTGDSAVPADRASYRCDRLVDDVEVLRAHMGLDHMDLLAHSAGGSLAMLYAARHPERVARLTLITATPWALDMPATPEDRLAAARLRKGEPWFEDAFGPFEAWLAGEGAFDPAATRAALADLPAPVLVLAGELDGGPRPDLARRAADVFRDAESAVQPGAGHYPWLDDPEWFVRRVTAFLDGRSGSLPSAE